MDSAHERSLYCMGFDEPHDDGRGFHLFFSRSFQIIGAPPLLSHFFGTEVSLSGGGGVFCMGGIHQDGKGPGAKKTGAWDKDPACVFYFILIVLDTRSTTTPDDDEGRAMCVCFFF